MENGLKGVRDNLTSRPKRMKDFVLSNLKTILNVAGVLMIAGGVVSGAVLGVNEDLPGLIIVLLAALGAFGGLVIATVLFSPIYLLLDIKEQVERRG